MKRWRRWRASVRSALVQQHLTFDGGSRLVAGGLQRTQRHTVVLVQTRSLL